MSKKKVSLTVISHSKGDELGHPRFIEEYIKQFDENVLYQVQQQIF